MLMEVCGFSENASRLAVGEVDGRIKFVDCGTSEVLQEFTPSGHLSAACCCVSWQPAELADSSASNRRRSVTSSKLVALGCVNGTILLYDYAKSEVVGRLEGGHSDRVTCIRWHPSRRNTLFSGGQDSHIVEWNTAKRAVRNRWKADRHAVFAIELFETVSKCEQNGVANESIEKGENGVSNVRSTLWLVSASRTIKLWNVDTQECVAVLSAHTGEVHFLRLAEPTSTMSAQRGVLLVSASKQERIGYVWRLDTTQFDESNAKRKQKVVQPVGYLKADSDTRSLACVHRNDTVVVAMVTQSGELHIYDFKQGAADGAQQREPTKSVRIGARKASSRFKQYTIISCSVSIGAQSDAVLHNGAHTQVSLTIAYRTRLVCAVETVRYEELQTGSNVLEREERVAPTTVASASLRVVTADATVSQTLSTAAARKVREPIIGNAARYVGEAEAERFHLDGSVIHALTPPISAPSSDASDLTEAERDRLAGDAENDAAPQEPTLGDRLRSRKRKGADDVQTAMDTDEPDASKRLKAPVADVNASLNVPAAIGGDSVLTVLMQGLQSGDEKLLDSVFRPVRNITTIRRTIEQVPAVHLGLLVRELLRRVQDASQKTELTMRWIRATISAHAAHFAFQPAAMRTLCSMRQLFEARMRTFPDLLSLNGRLELVLDQVDRQCSSTASDSGVPGRRKVRPSQQPVVFRDSDTDSDSDAPEFDDDNDLNDANSQELFDEAEFEKIAQQTSSQEESDGDSENADDDDDGDEDNDKLAGSEESDE